MLVYIIAGDVDLDHLVKVVSARLLHGKVTIFSFIDNNLGGDILILSFA